METRLPLVGREQILRRVARSLRQLDDGRRLMVTIVGERGSGRTRIVREVRAMPELADALVLELRLDGGAVDVETALRRALQEELVLRRAVVHLPHAATVGDGQIAPSLGRLAAVMPLVVIVDDLDCDAHAAVSLGEILAVVDAPWLVIATTRPAHAAAATITGRAADARIVELQSERFDHDQVGALLRTLLDEEPDGGDVGWLVERTHGLPVLLREAIEAALRSGAILRDGTRMRRIRPIDTAADELARLVPLTVPELGALSSGELEALASLALLGERIPRRHADALGVSHAVIDSLIARELLRTEDSLLCFECRLLHEASLARARELGLDTLHAPVLARIVTNALDGSLNPPACTLDAVIATSTSIEARRELLVRMLGAAMDLIGRGEYGLSKLLMDACYDESRALVADPVRAAEWFEGYSGVLHTLGRIDEQQRIIEEFLARNPVERAEARLLPTIARAMLWRVEILERGKLAEAALTLLDEVEGVIGRIDEMAIARALAARAVMGRARILNVIDRRDEALALLQRLFDDLDAEAQLPVLFDALLVYARTAAGHECAKDADERLAALQVRFEREGLERLAIQMRAGRIGLHTQDDEFDCMETDVRALVEQTRRCSLPRTESNAWLWLAVILADRGELADALEAIDHSIEIRWRVGSIALWQLAMITRAQILVWLRRDDEALATIAQVDEDARRYGRPYRRFLAEVARATVAIRRGEWGGCAETLAELAGIGAEEPLVATTPVLLDLEGEHLLHTYSIDREGAADYARRVIAVQPNRLSERLLYAVALAVMARSLDEGVEAKRGKSAKPDPLMAELRARLSESMTLWEVRRAEANVHRALAILRAHAPRELTVETLASLGAPIPDAIAAHTWHLCQIETFGAMRVTDATGVERGGRHFGQHKTDSKPKKMLAALVVATILGRRLKRERLIDMVWGEGVTAETAANNFHVTLSGLRQVVGDVVDFDGVGYTLNTRLAALDAVRLVELVEEASRHQRAGLLFRAFALQREACAIARGEFLEGIYDEWTDGARDLIRAKTRTARLRAAEIALLRGELDVVREAVGAMLEVDAFDEEALYLQLSLLERDGERLRAVRAFDAFAARIVSELGTEPSSRLRQLRNDIAAGADSSR